MLQRTFKASVWPRYMECSVEVHRHETLYCLLLGVLVITMNIIISNSLSHALLAAGIYRMCANVNLNTTCTGFQEVRLPKPLIECCKLLVAKQCRGILLETLRWLIFDWKKFQFHWNYILQVFDTLIDSYTFPSIPLAARHAFCGMCSTGIIVTRILHMYCSSS